MFGQRTGCKPFAEFFGRIGTFDYSEVECCERPITDAELIDSQFSSYTLLVHLDTRALTTLKHLLGSTIGTWWRSSARPGWVRLSAVGLLLCKVTSSLSSE